MLGKSSYLIVVLIKKKINLYNYSINMYSGKSFTKSQMALAYGIPIRVFRSWLKDLSEVLETGNRKYLFPKEIEFLRKERGEPNWDLIPEK